MQPDSPDRRDAVQPSATPKGNCARPEPPVASEEGRSAPAGAGEALKGDGSADRASANESSTTDRRTSLRRRKQLAVLIVNPARSEEPHRGWLLDRSLGGLCLSMDEGADEGTLLRVRATNAPSRLPWVEVQVKNCRRKESGWEVGCQYVRTPSWEVLLTFG